MAGRWDSQRKNFGSQYTPNQILGVLGECRIGVDSEAGGDFLCFCPFHGNNNTPSFSVSQEGGAFICFNPACNETGSIVELIKRTTGRNEFEARRLLLKKGGDAKNNFAEQLGKVMEKKVEFTRFGGDLEKMKQRFWDNPEAIAYMHNRQFTDETLDYFDIGYSNLHNLNLITVPMHDPTGVMPIGLIGRCIDEKKFKNSTNLPKSQTLWNLHRARQYDSVIICEASFDAMRVHQAGYPNVVAILGGSVSPRHFEFLARYFNTIIIMTDFDDKDKQMYKNCVKCAKRGHTLCLGHNPGRDLGQKLEDGLAKKKVMWASYKYGQVYPNGAKDAGDMTDDEIRTCIKNAVSGFEYRTWSLY